MSLLRINVTIQGVAPLLMNKFSDESALKATSGSTTSAAAREQGTPRSQAEKKLHLNEAGEIAVPQENLLSCIMAGGTYFKVGRKTITTQKSSLIPACVQIHAPTLKLEYRDPWDVDTRPVRLLP